MIAAIPERHSADASQRRLIAEIAWLKLRLEQGIEAPRAEGSVAADVAAAPDAIDSVTSLFGLTAFERDLLLLCAGVELDAELARRCGTVTFGLALAMLDDAHWSAMSTDRPLRRWRLIEVDDRAGIAAGRVRIDERVLHFLVGVNALDSRLRPLVRYRPRPAAMAESQRRVSESIARALRSADAPRPAVVLSGDDPEGRLDVAAEAVGLLGLGLHVVRLEDLPLSPAELEAFAVLWQREAALLGSALFVNCGDSDLPGSLVRFVEAPGSVAFLGMRDRAPVGCVTPRFTIEKPRAAERRRLWDEALGDAATRYERALPAVVSQFQLSARTIHAVGRVIRSSDAGLEQPDSTLWDSCRIAGRTRLDDLAQRLDPVAKWDDLVLPDAQKAVLQAIAAHARHRTQVIDEWGFAGKGSRGLGLTALFAGESGTGKTMAAEVLANDLRLDLYRIDLSAVVSKYIGETEKNLRKVFDAAEDGGAMLLFDEADALFGKRSEVRDSHDRYANIEVSYLLQRMESFSGLAILTTNMRSALDTAFQRRLRFVVRFPFPNAAEREAIWRGAFPTGAPIEGLEAGRLARLNVTGGSIRNIALDAAFRAAEARTPVRMGHLLLAAHSDAAKHGRALSDAETRGWV